LRRVLPLYRKVGDRFVIAAVGPEAKRITTKVSSPNAEN
jgi:hypothetical protein